MALYDGIWCWVQPKYVCRDSADSYLLTNAIAEFYTNLERKWEYNAGGRGGDEDGDTILETDCYYLVDYSLKISGYNGLGSLGTERCQPWQPLTPPRAIYTNPEYFCRIDYEDAQPGDIILFVGVDESNKLYKCVPGHIAFLATSPREENGVWTGTLFEATRKEHNGQSGVILGRPWSEWGDEVKWKDDQGQEHTGYLVPFGVFRPKRKVWVTRCWGAPDEPEPTPAGQPHDPLMLDFGGDGIGTLGTDAGIYFDHDGDGFKELTGWVDAGDGILMLDVNGNGRLDDGSELFGDTMSLANGRPAASGFEALAQYDSNLDGIIDANDPIWSQLKVWQHDTYVPPEGGG
ncbi:MAG: hypothetical protein V1792_19685 [Pseudomonadota bacterium]